MPNLRKISDNELMAFIEDKTEITVLDVIAHFQVIQITAQASLDRLLKSNKICSDDIAYSVDRKYFIKKKGIQ